MVNLIVGCRLFKYVIKSFNFSSPCVQYLAFTAPDEGEFCLTEILGNKIIALLSCPISLAIGFLFYSTLLILIYTKIRPHLATVCPSGPCIELPDLMPKNMASKGGGRQRKNMVCKGVGTKKLPLSLVVTASVIVQTSVPEGQKIAFLRF